MVYHKLLLRQLNRLNVNPDKLSFDQATLENFLQAINKSYLEADQERYLYERAMKLSSQEFLDLNKQLEIAEHMGHIGYWEADITNNKVFWSKELYLLYDLNPGSFFPKYDTIFDYAHEDDRMRMKSLLDRSLIEEGTYENELRSKIASGEYHWFYIKFQSFLKEGSQILRGIAIDITDRKKAEEEIASLNNQLVFSSRLAGMADVAASTLHNVGNVLNSANVSVEFLKEFLSQSKMTEVGAITALLQENLSRLSEYLVSDPQGKFVPEYIIMLLQKIHEEYDVVSKEIRNLSKYLSHVNDIIMTQNDISRVSGTKEKVFLPETVDEALNMVDLSFKEHNIDIVRNYQKTPFIMVDKVKLLQILVNLIRNAKDAVVENSINKEGNIAFFIGEDSLSNKLILKVKDNGIGVLNENLKKLFTLGFTTKERGHGLGLHMSAINAREIGGSLEVESEGLGKGTTFNLSIPKIEAPVIL